MIATEQVSPLMLCYCYADKDEKLLSEIEKHLSSLKRQNLISLPERAIPGSEWKRERIAALNAADVILLCISADFLDSEMCQLEMQQALTKHQMGKACVIPILFRPSTWEYEPFAHLQVLPTTRKAITNWRNRDAALAHVVSEIRKTILEMRAVLEAKSNGADTLSLSTQSKRHDYYAELSLPPNYIPREKVIEEAREVVLGGAQAVALLSSVQQQKASTIHGMGGIGKTVVARALCEDLQIQQAFPDGILWATLGQEPDLLAVLKEWITALGGEVHEHTPTIIRLKNLLTMLLKDRACLLILDDVWQQEHAQIFQVGSARCRLLLTTRDAEIAYTLGATIQSIPVMTAQEAITLLEDWAYGNLDETPVSVKAQVVKRLGYLPLAIRLAGTQLRYQSAEMWFQKFDVRCLKAKRARSGAPLSSVEETFELSLQALEEESPGTRRLFAALAIFKEDEAIPMQAIGRLWQCLNGLDGEATVELLSDLQARALLEQVSHARFSAFRIHDLLHELIRKELDDEYSSIHRIFLDSYRTTYPWEGWHIIPDDGYLYEHLAYHLHAASLYDELKGLFVNHSWLHVRVSQRGYTYDGYLEDLALAWQQADVECRQQIEAGLIPRALADAARYLLIWSSITSLTEQYIPELIGKAVQEGLWTPYRALRIAARNPDAEQRGRIYKALLQTDKLSQEEQEEAQKEGAAAILVLENEVRRARGLVALMPWLTEDLLAEALKAALALANDRWQAWVLEALAPRLTGSLLAEALKAALALAHEEERARVLEAMAPRLTEDLLAEALKAALVLENEEKRAELLMAIIPRLIGERRERMLVEALRAALVITYEGWRAEMLVVLVPQLTEDLLVQALQAALALKDEKKRAQVLMAIIPRLVGEQRERVLAEVLRAALAITDEGGRAKVETLAVLIPQLTEGLLEETLKAVLTITDEKGRARAEALATLAPQLTGALLEEALRAVLALEYESERAEALAALAPQLTGALLEEALRAELALKDEKERAEALAALTPQLVGEQQKKILAEVLGAALSLENEDGRVIVLAALVPSLTGSLLAEALRAVLVLVNDEWRAWMLVVLAPHLVGEQQKRMLAEALRATLAITSEMKRARVLKALVAQLTEGLLAEMLQAALALKDKKERAGVLVALASRLVGEQRKRMLAEALKATLIEGEEWSVWRLFSGESWRAKVLEMLVLQLTEDLLVQALEAALVLKDKKERAEVLIVLAPHLVGEQKEKVLAEVLRETLVVEGKEWRVWGLAYEKERAKMLTALVPQLTEGLLTETLETALASKDKVEQVEVLVALAPRLVGERRERVLKEMLGATLEVEGEGWRAWALEALAPQLTEGLLAEALKAALSIEYGRWRARVLGALAPRLVGEQREKVLAEALKAALAIENDRQQAEVLAILMPQLTEGLLEEALRAVLALKNERERVKILKEFLPFLAEHSPLIKTIQLTLLEILRSFNFRPRYDVFNLYANKQLFSSPVLSQDMLSMLISSIIEISNDWQWL